MRMEKYGLTLRRIEENDIELVRQWRNSERVRKNMMYQEYITPEMQKKWFDSVNNIKHSYYIIEYEGEKVGMINEKDIDFENMIVESGLFLFDEKYYNTIIPVLASLILLEVGYTLFNGNTGFIRVKKDNLQAVEYNKNLGYFIHEEKDDHYVMAVNKKSFEEKTVKLRKAVKNLYGDTKLRFIIEPIDFENGVAQGYLPHATSVDPKYILSMDIDGPEKVFILDV